MPKLTDVDCRNATCPPEKKFQRFNDGGCLYLEVSPKGSKRWFWKYTLAGAEKRLAIGSYPTVTLSAARRERDLAKGNKSLGTDPVQAKKVAKLKALIPADETFKAVALEWHALKKDSWGQAHTVREERNLLKDLIPYLGQRRIGDIEPVELLTVIRKVEERGSISVAHRVLTTAGAVWDHAVSTGRASRDISASLRSALKTHHPQHFAAIIEPVKFGELLRAIEGCQGSTVVRTALKLSPILFQRPGELRCATWSEFDLDNSTWTIPAKRMKRDKNGKQIGNAHMVPLPTQAVEILRDLQILTGHGRLLTRGPPLLCPRRLPDPCWPGHRAPRAAACTTPAKRPSARPHASCSPRASGARAPRRIQTATCRSGAPHPTAWSTRVNSTTTAR